jgi:hypothetical protein
MKLCIRLAVGSCQSHRQLGPNREKGLQPSSKGLILQNSGVVLSGQDTSINDYCALWVGHHSGSQAFYLFIFQMAALRRPLLVKQHKLIIHGKGGVVLPHAWCLHLQHACHV